MIILTLLVLVLVLGPGSVYGTDLGVIIDEDIIGTTWKIIWTGLSTMLYLFPSIYWPGVQIITFLINRRVRVVLYEVAFFQALCLFLENPFKHILINLQHYFSRIDSSTLHLHVFRHWRFIFVFGLFNITAIKFLK